MNRKDYDFIPLFAELTEDEAEKLFKTSEEKSYSAGEIIFAQGDKPDYLYIILDGDVAIENKPILEKENLTILTLSRGAFFGEMALFDEGPRSAGARAIKDTRLLLIDKSCLLATPSVSAKILLPLFSTLAPRIRSINRQITAFFETGRILTSSKDIEESLSKLLKLITGAVGVKKGIIYISSQASDVLEPAYTEGIDPGSILNPVYLKMPEGIITRLLDDKAPVNITGTEKVNKIYGFEDTFSLLIPIMGKKQLLGILILIGEKDFSYSDITLAMCITTQLSYLFENSLFIQEEENRDRLNKKYYRF